MNYKYTILRYLCLTAFFFVVWHSLEKSFLAYQEDCDLFAEILGTHGGYGHYTFIAGTFMILFLLLLIQDIKLFSLAEVARRGRRNTFLLTLLRAVQASAGYSFVYVLVQVICTCIYIDFKRLTEENFFFVMVLYYIAVFGIFWFGSTSFLVLYCIFRRFFASLIITVILNLIIAIFIKNDFWYGGLVIVDDMTGHIQTNMPLWILYRLCGFCVVGLLCVIAGSIYEKKDIL